MKNTLKKFGASLLFLLGVLSVSTFGYTKPSARRTHRGLPLLGKPCIRAGSSFDSGSLNMMVEISRPRIVSKTETPISSAVTAGLIQISFVAVDDVSEGQGDARISERPSFPVPDGGTLDPVASKPISPKSRH